MCTCRQTYTHIHMQLLNVPLWVCIQVLIFMPIYDATHVHKIAGFAKCMYARISTQIYIYREREREIESEIERGSEASMFMLACTYILNPIRIYISIYTYIYIYIHKQEEI